MEAFIANIYGAWLAYRERRTLRWIAKMQVRNQREMERVNRELRESSEQASLAIERLFRAYRNVAGEQA